MALLFEILLRLKILIPSHFDNDGWWKYRWQTRQRTKNGITEYPDRFDPLLGWVPKENFRLKNEFGSLTFNSLGIRSKNEYQTAKNKNLRIVSIGDSFTYGECVADDETYSAYLEHYIESSEVLNFGVHGYGLDQMYLRLLNALKYSPDIVIVGFVNSDISRNMLYFREYFKPRIILKNNELFITNVPLASPDSYSKKKHLLILDYLEMLIKAVEFRFNSQKIEAQKSDLSQKILTEMYSKTVKKSALFYLLYLPNLDEVKNDKAQPHHIYQKFCEQHKMKCIDPTSALNKLLKSAKDPEKLFRCHYSKEVHNIIANELKIALK